MADKLGKLLQENLDRIFCALALVWSMISFVLYKTGMMPMIKNGLTNVAAIAGKTSVSATSGEEVAKKTADALDRVSKAIAESEKAKRSDMRTMLDTMSAVSDQMAVLFACINTTAENREKFQAAYAATKSGIAEASALMDKASEE